MSLLSLLLVTGCVSRTSAVTITHLGDMPGWAKESREQCAGGAWATVDENVTTRFIVLTTGSESRQWNEMLFFCCPMPGSTPICRPASWESGMIGGQTRDARGSDSSRARGSTAPPKPTVPGSAIKVEGRDYLALDTKDVASLRSWKGKKVVLQTSYNPDQPLHGSMGDVGEQGLALIRSGEKKVYPWEEIKAVWKAR